MWFDQNGYWSVQYVAVAHMTSIPVAGFQVSYGQFVTGIPTDIHPKTLWVNFIQRDISIIVYASELERLWQSYGTSHTHTRAARVHVTNGGVQIGLAIGCNFIFLSTIAISNERSTWTSSEHAIHAERKYLVPFECLTRNSGWGMSEQRDAVKLYECAMYLIVSWRHQQRRFNSLTLSAEHGAWRYLMKWMTIYSHSDWPTE